MSLDEYPCPSVTVDVIIFTLRDSDLQVLLIKRKYPPFEGMWAVPGGFVSLEESLEEDPRGRVITVAYIALVPAPAIDPSAGSDAAEARWWSMVDLPPLSFDHKDILAYALQRLRYKLEYTAVGFELLPETFTLSELQAAYEIILGEELDKRNFRRKILSAKVIEETGMYRSGEGRPAKFYHFRDDAVAEVKARRLFP